MGLIHIGDSFKKHENKYTASAGPLSGGDSYHLYQIVSLASEHAEKHAADMDIHGYSGFHHTEFIDLFSEINKALCKAYDTGCNQPLATDTARAMYHNLRLVRTYLESAHIAPLETNYKEATEDYHLSLQAIPLRPHIHWAKSLEQERRRKTCEFYQTNLQSSRDILAHALRIETALESYCDKHDLCNNVIPLRIPAPE